MQFIDLLVLIISFGLWFLFRIKRKLGISWFLNFISLFLFKIIINLINLVLISKSLRNFMNLFYKRWHDCRKGNIKKVL